MEYGLIFEFYMVLFISCNILLTCSFFIVWWKYWVIMEKEDIDNWILFDDGTLKINKYI